MYNYLSTQLCSEPENTCKVACPPHQELITATREPVHRYQHWGQGCELVQIGFALLHVACTKGKVLQTRSLRVLSTIVYVTSVIHTHKIKEKTSKKQGPKDLLLEGPRQEAEKVVHPRQGGRSNEEQDRGRKNNRIQRRGNSKLTVAYGITELND